MLVEGARRQPQRVAGAGQADVQQARVFGALAFKCTEAVRDRVQAAVAAYETGLVRVGEQPGT